MMNSNFFFIPCLVVALASAGPAQIQSDFLRRARPTCDVTMTGASELTFQPTAADPDYHELAVLDSNGSVVATVALGVNRGGRIHAVPDAPGEFLVSGVLYPAYSGSGQTRGVFKRLRANSATSWTQLGASTHDGIDPYDFHSFGPGHLLVLDYKQRRLMKSAWDTSSSPCPSGSFTLAYSQANIPSLANPHLLAMVHDGFADIMLHDMSDYSGTWILSLDSSGSPVATRRDVVSAVVVPTLMPFPNSRVSIPLAAFGASGSEAFTLKDAAGSTVFSGTWPASSAIPQTASIVDHPGEPLTIHTGDALPVALIPIVRHGVGFSAPDANIGPIVYNPMGLFVGSDLNGHGVRVEFASGVSAQEVQATLLVGFRAAGQDPVVTYTLDNEEVTALDGTAVPVPFTVDLGSHQGWVGATFPVPNDPELESEVVLWQYVFTVRGKLALSEIFGSKIHADPEGMTSRRGGGVSEWRSTLESNVSGARVIRAHDVERMLRQTGWTRKS